MFKEREKAENCEWLTGIRVLGGSHIPDAGILTGHVKAENIKTVLETVEMYE